MKTMLYFGTDLYLLELRGHGKSSLEAQRRRARQEKSPLPRDLNHGWDLTDSNGRPIATDFTAKVGYTFRF